MVDPRFGRCPYFIIVDIDTMDFEAIPNTSYNALSGAGIEAAQIIANKGAKIVLTGNVGPKAYQALSAVGIQITTGMIGTVREAVTKYMMGELENNSNPKATTGVMAGSPGMHGRRRGGQGMSAGRGLSAYYNFSQGTPPFQMTKEQEIQTLQDQMKILQDWLDQIKKRLEELKS